MKKFKEFINESYVEELTKLKNTIKGCKTEDHIESAYNYFIYWKNKWKDELSDQDIQELDRNIKNKFQELKLD